MTILTAAADARIPASRARRVVVLYTNTGGGHKSVASAIVEGFAERSPETLVTVVDAANAYGGFILRRFPSLYSFASRNSVLWSAWYWTASSRFRASLWNRVGVLFSIRSLPRLFADHPADAYVSVHPAMNDPVRRALHRRGGPHPVFATVVTDLETMSPMWFDPSADLCLVPNGRVARLATGHGVDPTRVRVTGLPVRKAFLGADQERLRRDTVEELDLPVDRPIALVTAGAEGAARISRVVRALVRQLDASIIVVAGRNAGAHQGLSGSACSRLRILGHVSDMARLVAASDVVVTKAGPTTIHEAAAMKVPMVIFHHLPGQEAGNLALLKRSAAALVCLRESQVAPAARSAIQDIALRGALITAASSLVVEAASRTVADEVLAAIERRTAASGHGRR